MVAASATARQRTTRKGLKVETSTTADVQSDSSLIYDMAIVDSVTLAGYDKPLRSHRETLFVSNHLQADITYLIVHCEYYDMKGRQLHATDHKITCDIPAGETRQIYFSSWDKQQSFYYYLSSRPRRVDATPYKVKCRVTAVKFNQ